MYSKCYPIITYFFGAYGANQVPNDEKWRVFHTLGRHSYLMVQNISGNIRFSPIFGWLSAPPVTYPYRAKQASGLAGGHDYIKC